MIVIYIISQNKNHKNDIISQNKNNNSDIEQSNDNIVDNIANLKCIDENPLFYHVERKKKSKRTPLSQILNKFPINKQIQKNIKKSLIFYPTCNVQYPNTAPMQTIAHLHGKKKSK